MTEDAYDPTESSRIESDPVTMQVIGGELDTIVQEMGIRMVRSSYSPIIRENEDVGAGLYTVDGEQLAESDFTPMHVGSLPGYLDGLYEVFEERGLTLDEAVQPGDIFIHNHPYYGASHSFDPAIFVPIFYQEELIGWSAATAHLVDIGGRGVGYTIELDDMYEEGQLFKARRLYRDGEKVTDVWNHITDNTRTPDLNNGDIEAIISATRAGAERYLDLVEQKGLETIQSVGQDLLDYAELMMRNAVRKVPDGEYHAESYLDDDGVNRGKRLKVDVVATVQGSEITVDLSESADQVPTAFNVPFRGSTKVAIYFTLRAILLDTFTNDEWIPQNSGSFRPVHVTAREGSIFNPKPPAAAQARINQLDLLGDTLMMALSEAIPDKVVAGTNAQCNIANYSGLRPGTDEYWVYVQVTEGAYGASDGEDGMHAVDALIHNTRNRPVEDIELEDPLRVDRYELREDDQGAGKYRGGHGVVREMTFMADTDVSTISTGKYHRPPGLFGGEDAPSLEHWQLHMAEDDPTPDIYSERNQHIEDDTVGSEIEAVEELDATFDQTFERGDRFIMRIPSGGGYGNPLERPVESVYEDYLDGLISEQKARDSYGVVITDGNVDTEATADLRSR